MLIGYLYVRILANEIAHHNASNFHRLARTPRAEDFSWPNAQPNTSVHEYIYVSTNGRRPPVHAVSSLCPASFSSPATPRLPSTAS